MGLYDSTNEEVKTFRGLHLYHFAISNCSQRVRLALEEKGLAWTSHLFDPLRNEHVTAEYRSINPKGVVPTLVHDGQVIVESNDILQYLDERFPEPPLQPTDPSDRSAMVERLVESGAVQPAIKTLSHELLFKPFRKVGPDDIALYRASGANPELADFMRDYAEDGPAWRERGSAASAAMDAALERLDAALRERPWLSGERYGLADVSWVVNTHRLVLAGYDFEAFPRLRAWHARAAARPSFDRAVASYRP